jgi:hypothetical protein
MLLVNGETQDGHGDSWIEHGACKVQLKWRVVGQEGKRTIG